MNRFLLISLKLLIVCTTLLGQNTQVKIDSQFPGGNIRILKIERDTVWLSPDLRDTRGDWFYWNFNATGTTGKTIWFQFAKNDCIGPMGPACSYDKGLTWQWLGKNDYALKKGFSYQFPESTKNVQFCMSIPYTQKNLEEFLKKFADSPYLKQSSLCLSEKGRNVEKLIISNPKSKPTVKLIITARHHACEMMANYVMEGIISAILTDKRCSWLKEKAEIMFIPFVDKDGVEDGDQGKNRQPRDHNRDYDSTSIYKSITAIRNQVPLWGEGKLKFALDLHCPYSVGEDAEKIHVVGSKHKNIEAQQMIFKALLETNNKGPLKFYSKDFVAFGTSWNAPTSFIKGKSFGIWAGELSGVALAQTIEIPYSIVYGETITPEKARIFGAELATTIQDYLIKIN